MAAKMASTATSVSVLNSILENCGMETKGTKAEKATILANSVPVHKLLELTAEYAGIAKPKAKAKAKAKTKAPSASFSDTESTAAPSASFSVISAEGISDDEAVCRRPRKRQRMQNDEENACEGICVKFDPDFDAKDQKRVQPTVNKVKQFLAKIGSASSEDFEKKLEAELAIINENKKGITATWHPDTQYIDVSAADKDGICTIVPHSVDSE